MAKELKIGAYHRNHEYSKKEVFTKTQGKCIYCGIEFLDEHDPHFTLEHLIPLSKGGPDDLSNVYPCCQKCNTNRGSIELDEWLKVLVLKRQLYKGVYHITNRLDQIISKLKKILKGESKFTF